MNPENMPSTFHSEGRNELMLARSDFGGVMVFVLQAWDFWG